MYTALHIAMKCNESCTALSTVYCCTFCTEICTLHKKKTTLPHTILYIKVHTQLCHTLVTWRSGTRLDSLAWYNGLVCSVQCAVCLLVHTSLYWKLPLIKVQTSKNCIWLTAHCTLRTTHCSLTTAHSIIQNTHCTLYILRCTLHTKYYTLKWTLHCNL